MIVYFVSGSGRPSIVAHPQIILQYLLYVLICLQGELTIVGYNVYNVNQTIPSFDLCSQHDLLSLFYRCFSVIPTLILQPLRELLKVDTISI